MQWLTGWLIGWACLSLRSLLYPLSLTSSRRPRAPLSQCVGAFLRGWLNCQLEVEVVSFDGFGLARRNGRTFRPACKGSPCAMSVWCLLLQCSHRFVVAFSPGKGDVAFCPTLSACCAGFTSFLSGLHWPKDMSDVGECRASEAEHFVSELRFHADKEM